MIRFDCDEIRAKIRTMDFMPGSTEEVAAWKIDDADSRANLMIDGLIPGKDEDQLFALMIEEAVPPHIQTRIILEMLKANYSS